MTALTGYERDRTGVFIRKAPSAVLDYTVDWADWLPDGETISTLSCTASTISGDGSPLTVDSSSISSAKTTAYLSAGTAGKVYTITWTITTSGALTESREFRVLVENRSV